MKTERIDLYEYFGIERKGGEAGYLYSYIIEQYDYCPKRIRPAMLVIAGGGYSCVSARESEPIALNYIAEGYCAFALDYSVMPVRFPVQLLEGCMAMAYIRENAEKLGIDKEHVSAIGFSAGGHLCGMLATMWDEKEIKEFLGEKVILCRPDAVILSYPVITSGEFAHKGSIINLSGEKEQIVSRISLEKRVDKNSVPAFIWTTMDDACVPMENSILMASAYKKAGVPFELHIFESGQHGLSLCTKEVNTVNEPVSKWKEMSKTWLKNRGFEIKD